MSVEIHVNCRQKLLPDPEFDAVAAIFYLVNHDIPEHAEDALGLKRNVKGIVHVSGGLRCHGRADSLAMSGIDGGADIAICQVGDERSLFQELITVIKVRQLQHFSLVCSL